MLTKIEKETNFLMQALKNASVGVWHIDLLHSQFHVNDSFTETAGLDMTMMTKVSERGWFETSDKLLLPFISEIKNQIEHVTGDSFSTNQWFTCNNGKTIFAHITGKITEVDANGKVIQATGTLYDRTEMFESQQNLQYRFEIEQLVSGISAEFIGSHVGSLDETINKSLKKIGEFCKIDRSYLFLLSEDGKSMSNTHEWCAPNIDPEIDNLQGIPCSVFPWWIKKLRNGRRIYIHKVENLPEEAAAEREALTAQSIKSVLVVPMKQGQKLIGFIGFDSVTEYKLWNESDIQLLTTVANTFSNAIIAKQNNDLLVKEKEKAEEANRLKSAFLATINHELRTPLHHILGFSDLLKGMNLKKVQIEQYASKIYESGKNLLQIVEDILSLATGNPSEVKVRAELIHGIDLFVQHKAYMSEILANANRENDIILNLHPSPEFLSAKFYTDKNKINQIVSNLFKNAVKFTRRGTINYGITITGNELQLYLEDDGIGIPLKNRDIIFDYFRQGDDTSTRRFQGIGIGLSICKNLVQILNGTIKLESEIGYGSKFTVNIPVSTASVYSKKMDLSLIFPIPDYTKFRFLIVDQDPNSTFLLKDLLSATHANILATGNDTEALAYMGESCFLDIILIDIGASPNRSLNLINEMNNRCQKCAIVGLSSHSLINERKKALSVGCVEVISKPIEPQLLYEAIQKGLNKKAEWLRKSNHLHQA